MLGLADWGLMNLLERCSSLIGSVLVYRSDYLAERGGEEG